jgi:hypothetical protein
MSAGKGDSPRNCFSREYRQNFDAIFKKSSVAVTDAKQRPGLQSRGSRTSKPNSLEPNPLAPAPHSLRTVPPYPHEL